MTTLTIASWNVNSLRVRFDHLSTWLQTHAIDVVMLQETKCTDDQFPLDMIEALRYQALFNGQKSYNGVACLTHQPVTPVFTDHALYRHEQKRFLAVDYQGILIVNVYVPNGQAIASEKFNYKCTWLAMLLAFIQEAQQRYDKIVILGDFNIAPTAKDHTSADYIGDAIMKSPMEQAIFQQILDLGFVDSYRLFHEEDKQYTWWDYRLKAFDRNMGYRIDHILVSQTLQPQCQACDIDKSLRALDKPSDHAPVILRLSL